MLNTVPSATRAVALVIEDDPSTRTLLMRALRSIDVACLGVGSGEAALAWVEMNGAPSLVSLDLCLPHMSGWRVCEWLRARDARIPIVVVTARAEMQDEASALEHDVEYLTKPFRVRAYQDTVRRLLPPQSSPGLTSLGAA